MSAKNSPNWKWHLWRKDRKTSVKTYIGFYYDEKGALADKRKRAEKDPDGAYSVLDYGPLELAKRSAPTKTTTVRAPGTAEKAMAEARAESVRRDRERTAARAEAKRKDDERKAADREAMAGIVSDAEGLLEQHKADERADLEAGINR